MKKYFLLFLICFIVNEVNYCQNSENLDSLFQLEKDLTSNRNAESNNKLFDVYYKIWTEISYNDFRLGAEYALKMVEQSKKTKNEKHQLIAYLHLGMSYDNSSDYLNALDTYAKLKSLSISFKDTLYLSYAYLNEAIVFSKISRFDESLKSNTRALYLLKKLNSRYEEIVSVYNNLGILYKKIKHYDDAEKSYSSAIKILRQEKDTFYLSYLENNLASLYLVTEQFEKAHQHAQKAINYSQAVNDKHLEASNLNLMGNVFAAQNNFKEAERFYLLAINLRDSIGDFYGKSESLIDYGKCMMALGNYPRAEKTIKEGLDLMNANSDPQLKSAGYKLLADLNEKTSNYAGAYQYLKLYNSIDDSLFNTELVNKIAELNIGYAYELKADSINAANINHLNLINEQNKVDNTVRNAIILITLLIIFFLWILLYQKNKLSELRRLKSIESERYRISRDLHDGLGSGITGVVMLTQQLHPKMESEKLFKNISKINLTLIDILGQLSDIVWTLNVNNETVNDLIHYFHKISLDFFEDSTIELKFELPENIANRKLSSIERRNLLMIFKETLNNVMKHSKAEMVHIHCESRKKTFTILILDNGKGFSQENLLKQGNGLKNAKIRMKEIGGNYHVESEPGKGTRVSITF